MRLPGALLRHTYPATVSERLRQGSKTVSLAAEIIHHKATATTDRGFRLILYRAVAGHPRENPAGKTAAYIADVARLRATTASNPDHANQWAAPGKPGGLGQSDRTLFGLFRSNKSCLKITPFPRGSIDGGIFRTSGFDSSTGTGRTTQPAGYSTYWQ